MQKRIKEVEERARTFRLVNSGTQDSFSGMKEQEKWLVASVKEIEGAVGAALEIAEMALRTHTCAAFLLTLGRPAPQAARLPLRLRARAARARSPRARASWAGVLKRRAPVRHELAAGLKGITYYEGGAPGVRACWRCRSWRARGLVRGVLVADRLTHEPFTERRRAAAARPSPPRCCARSRSSG